MYSANLQKYLLYWKFMIPICNPLLWKDTIKSAECHGKASLSNLNYKNWKNFYPSSLTETTEIGMPRTLIQYNSNT